MPYYLFRCECGEEWEKKGSMQNPPKKSKCKSCGKWGKRVYEAPPVHFKGVGWPGEALKRQKRFDTGMDKQEAISFYNTAIKDSKQRMKEGGQAYTRYKMDKKYMLEKGRIKKLDRKKAEEKRKKIQSVAKIVVDNTKVDPTVPVNNQEV